jgi:hypothetical protein
MGRAKCRFGIYHFKVNRSSPVECNGFFIGNSLARPVTIGVQLFNAPDYSHEGWKTEKGSSAFQDEILKYLYYRMELLTTDERNSPLLRFRSASMPDLVKYVGFRRIFCGQPAEDRAPGRGEHLPLACKPVPAHQDVHEYLISTPAGGACEFMRELECHLRMLFLTQCVLMAAVVIISIQNDLRFKCDWFLVFATSRVDLNNANA